MKRNKIISLLTLSLVALNSYALYYHIDNTQNKDSIRFYAHLDLCKNVNVNIAAKKNKYIDKGICCLAGGERMSVSGTSGAINGQTVMIPNPSNRCTDKTMRIIAMQKNGRLIARIETKADVEQREKRYREYREYQHKQYEDYKKTK